MPTTSSVFDLPDPLLGTNNSWSSWANDLNGTTPADHSSWMPQQTYAWDTNVHGGLDYDPLPQGTPYDPVSVTLGAQNTQAGIDAWLRKTYPQLYSFTDSNLTTNAGTTTDLGGDWAGVDKWDSTIATAAQAAATKYGVYVPVNLVKSIMKLESNGENLAANDSGASGPMQVVGSIWSGLGYNLDDPVGNIMAGVDILAQNYLSGDPSDPTKKSWEWAAKRYLGLGAEDSNHTTPDSYWDTVSKNWSALGTGGSAQTAAGGAAAPNTAVFNSIWRGGDAPITQGFGFEDCKGTDYCFARDSDYAKTAYGYTDQYTTDGSIMGHAGVDVGVAYNTQLYAPQGGTVLLAGGTGYYCDSDGNGCGPGVGELAIQYANGDQLILGHMSQIVKADGTPYQIGDTIQPGQFVGYSGSENGAHVHVEYRKAVGACTNGFDGTCTDSGWQVVDPRLALTGVFTGNYGKAGSGAVLAAAPNDWNTFMMNASLGLPINGNGASVGGFHDWLTSAMGVGGTANVFGDGSVNAADPTRWIFNKAPSSPAGGAAGGGPTQT